MSTVIGIPNDGTPINLKTDGMKASLRGILGSKQMMDNHNILWKLTQHVPQEGVTLKGYYQSCKDDQSKQQHLDYTFQKLDRAPIELDLLFTPMHIETNHWALLVINIKEKEFHVYDSLRNKNRPDILEYVEILRTYIKGRDLDTTNWPLC
ncbi:hypothetical protein Taro_013310 [Colocasia esculenta]|uniref:Ubiquitin-like protease family profile domain-containing protein n=1 Tax=Colocasia esculenta TaxID=4460 RepID=A0A843UG32_COLES|nr:hypothetical protein [Colocasia esculenta]